ncbi:MAG: hypothetical protein AAGJ35_04405, partial [Myxococcota bacterium]
TFRVGPNDPFTLNVLDNDGAAGVQMKTDLIGTYTAASVPKELLEGKTLTLKSFGQVESLVLEAKVVEAPKSTGCEGVYNVRIVEFDVKNKQENGKPWDLGFGSMKKPDVIVKLKVGSHTINTPKFNNKTTATINNVQKTIPVKKGTPVTLEVTDADIGKDQVIGQTAASDVCTLINASGKHTFTNFGQVNKVVLIFEKKQ